jgi:hypothetical protein
MVPVDSAMENRTPRNALEYVLQMWCMLQEAFQGDYFLKVRRVFPSLPHRSFPGKMNAEEVVWCVCSITALAKLFLLNDERLHRIQVPGDLLVTPSYVFCAFRSFASDGLQSLMFRERSVRDERVDRSRLLPAVVPQSVRSLCISRNCFALRFVLEVIHDEDE